jgi:hypothetical protein
LRKRTLGSRFTRGKYKKLINYSQILKLFGHSKSFDHHLDEMFISLLGDESNEVIYALLINMHESVLILTEDPEDERTVSFYLTQKESLL